MAFFVQNQNNKQPNIVTKKEFVDRREPRSVFWSRYNQIQEAINSGEQLPISVITYYGYGGIGKTALVNQIATELSEKAPSTKIEFVDFEKITAFNNNVLEILRLIEADLRKKYKFTFPIFDLVAYKYELKLGRNPSKPELKKILGNNEELNFLNSIIAEIPVVNMISKIVNIAEKADEGRTLIKRRLQNNHLKGYLLELEGLNELDYVEKLPYFFALDLTENIKKDNTPLVFIIDTYERLVNELGEKSDVLDDDEWLKGTNGLIRNTPNTLWVIAGREKLQWEKTEPEWEGSLLQHSLAKLPKEDAVQFLQLAGINDTKLQEVIFASSDGYPFHLDICVNTYRRLLESGKTPVPSDFDGDTEKMLKRFFKYMSDNERDFTTMLAFLPEWTDHNIDYYSTRILGHYPPHLYNKIRNFSFVITTGDSYRIDDTVKKFIINNTEKLTKERTERILDDIDYEKLQEILNYEHRHAARFDSYDNKQTYRKIVIRKLKKLSNITDSQEFENLGTSIVKNIEQYESVFDEKLLKANEYIDFQKAQQFNSSVSYWQLYCKQTFINSTYKDFLSKKEDSTLFKTYQQMHEMLGEEQAHFAIEEFLRSISFYTSRFTAGYIRVVQDGEHDTLNWLYDLVKQKYKPTSFFYQKVAYFANPEEFFNLATSFSAATDDYTERNQIRLELIALYYGKFLLRDRQDSSNIIKDKSIKVFANLKTAKYQNYLSRDLLTWLERIVEIEAVDHKARASLIASIFEIAPTIIDGGDPNIMNALRHYMHGILLDQRSSDLEKIQSTLLLLRNKYLDFYGNGSKEIQHIDGDIILLDSIKNPELVFRNLEDILKNESILSDAFLNAFAPLCESLTHSVNNADMRLKIVLEYAKRIYHKYNSPKYTETFDWKKAEPFFGALARYAVLQNNGLEEFTKIVSIFAAEEENSKQLNAFAAETMLYTYDAFLGSSIFGRNPKLDGINHANELLPLYSELYEKYLPASEHKRHRVVYYLYQIAIILYRKEYTDSERRLAEMPAAHYWEYLDSLHSIQNYYNEYATGEEDARKNLELITRLKYLIHLYFASEQEEQNGPSSIEYRKILKESTDLADDKEIQNLFQKAATV